MDSRRSYLDTLNAGRQRRDGASLEQITQSLMDLESRLGRSADAPNANRRGSYARPAEQRETLRQPMPADPRSEFADLRGQLNRMLDSNREAAALAPAHADETDRISRAMHALSDRADEPNIKQLRGEIEHLRSALDTLARDDSLRSPAQPDERERRWSASEFEARPNRLDMAAMADRLQAISDAVSNLPRTLPLNALEERVRMLAGAVEQFVRQHERHAPEMFRMIEDRLDEISRAIVASTAVAKSPLTDLEPFHRIEARISALARQIGEVVEGQPSAEIIDRLAALSQRVEDLFAQGGFPEMAMERLSRQVHLIADRIDRTPADADRKALLAAIDQRFELLSTMIERRQADAMEHGSIMFREMERRLDRVAFASPETADMTRIIGAIDAGFADLANRVDASASGRTGFDRDAIRNLESQVAALSSQLGGSAPDMGDIGPRLGELERAIAENRDSILETARQAAESALRGYDGSHVHTAAVEGLAEDLKALESLTRRSDDRNARTFEAIHGTLVRIVDQLNLLDIARAGAEPAGITDADTLPADARRKSFLGGLARANPPKDASPEADAAFADTRRKALLGEPLDVRIANRPLEPGSGAPDVSAIMRRVREERAQSEEPGETDVAKADLIAAARRAAQAAAADPDARKERDGAAQPPGGRIGGFFRRRAAALLLAATAIPIVLAGLELANDFSAVGKSVQPSDTTFSSTELPADLSTELPADAVAPRTVTPLSPPGAESEVGNDAIEGLAGEASAEPGAAGIAPFEPTMPVSPGDPAPAAVDPADGAMAQPPADAAATVSAPYISPAAAPGDAATSPAPTVAPAISVPAEAGPAALREAAEAGDAKALFELGSRYTDGRGVKRDMHEASIWYERSAELGFAPAQYRVGNLYEKALGVERDTAKARTWYQLAADQGNASAMHNLAVLYAMGAEGAPDNASAARWFTSAAELGVKDSQFNLGVLAAKGVGMKQSLEESYKWFALAAKSGDSDAASKRDEIANSLRPDQLEKAKATVEQWKPTPVNPEANTVEIPDSWQDEASAPVETTANVDMKKAIGNIQRILNKNGYDAGTADGVMGEMTKSAIMAFQMDNDMSPDGQVDEKLVKALLAKK